jgi:hypothetical protein
MKTQMQAAQTDKENNSSDSIRFPDIYHKDRFVTVKQNQLILIISQLKG